MPGKPRGRPFQKGNLANPHGRPKVILPEVQNLIEQNKNALKVLLIQKIDPKVEQWIDSIISMGIHEGDAVKLKMLLEMALGKMIDEPTEFHLSDEEKLLILEYRRRKKEALEQTLTGSVEVSR